MKNIIKRYMAWSLLSNVRTLVVVRTACEALAIMTELALDATADSIQCMRSEPELSGLVKDVEKEIEVSARSAVQLSDLRDHLIKIERGQMPPELGEVIVAAYMGDLLPLIDAVCSNNRKF